MKPLHVALVGDHDPTVVAHRAIPVALDLASSATGIPVVGAWLPTNGIAADDDLAEFDAVWCTPASPYRSEAGALRAIRVARETGRPFLGTCGGFQHALLEYARHVLGWHDAEHGETAPTAERLVITPLACAMVETTGAVTLQAGSRIHAAYGATTTSEGYHCRYGLNPAMQEALVGGPLHATAHDEAGDTRAVELDGHPFFVATLFQPERSALQGQVPPLAVALVQGAALRRARTMERRPHG